MKYMSSSYASHTGWETKKMEEEYRVMSGVDKERSSIFRCQLSLLQETVVSCYEKAGELSRHSEGLFESLLSLRRYL